MAEPLLPGGVAPEAFSSGVRELRGPAMICKLFKVAVLALVVGTPVLAHESGQFSNVPDTVRAWFKNVKSQRGIPCCDIADGHRTDYDMRDNQYWVPVNGKWLPVPPEAVIRDSGNLTGDAVVWYSAYGEYVMIRCFVPGGGA